MADHTDTTPTWTIDDDGWLTFDHNKVMIADWDMGESLRPDAFAALVADVRAARAHEHCGTATDTLRRAYKRWLTAVEADKIEDRLNAAPAVFRAVADLLVDGGTDG